ncbi:hypothetical protein [uncultured Psychrobacter sp.]|uniref:hypothetical protein n=1 Tax=uncultured Psychrobacter sp. TaxID=259303 RepID=UPI0030DCE8E2
MTENQLQTDTLPSADTFLTPNGRCVAAIKKTLESMGWAVWVGKDCICGQQQWKAPLYAEKGKAKMAIELLWADADIREIGNKNILYKRAGIRALWLVYGDEDECGRCALENEFTYRYKELPVFKFSIREDDAAYVHNVFFYNETYTDYDGIAFTLQDFIKSMFSGDIYFKLRIDGERTMNLITYSRDCWKCKKATTIVAGVRYYENPYGLYDVQVPNFDFTVRDVPLADINIINQQLAGRLRFGTLKPRYSKTLNESYMSNGCFHCDALLGAFFEEYDFEADNAVLSAECIASHKHIHADIGEWVLKDDKVSTTEFLPNDDIQIEESLSNIKQYHLDALKHISIDCYEWIMEQGIDPTNS